MFKTYKMTIFGKPYFPQKIFNNLTELALLL